MHSTCRFESDFIPHSLILTQIFVDECVNDTIFLESVLARNPRLVRCIDYMETEVFELPRSEFEKILDQANSWQAEKEIKVEFISLFSI